MRTETQTIEIYKFNELPEKVQSKICEEWRHNDYFYWGDEWQNTLDRFCVIFPFVNVKNWEIDYCRAYTLTEINVNCLDYYYGEEIPQLSGVRLFKWLRNNNHEYLGRLYDNDQYLKDWKDCPLTGYCGDYYILEPLAKFMEKPCKHTTLESLFIDCIQSWAKGYQKDYEYWLSEECIKEEIDCNDYEFTIDGKIYN